MVSDHGLYIYVRRSFITNNNQTEQFLCINSYNFRRKCMDPYKRLLESQRHRLHINVSLWSVGVVLQQLKLRNIDCALFQHALSTLYFFFLSPSFSSREIACAEPNRSCAKLLIFDFPSRNIIGSAGSVKSACMNLRIKGATAMNNKAPVHHNAFFILSGEESDSLCARLRCLLPLTFVTSPSTVDMYDAKENITRNRTWQSLRHTRGRFEFV